MGGDINDNGELLANFFAFHDMVIRDSMYTQKYIHDAKYASTEGHTKDQINFVSNSKEGR